MKSPEEVVADVESRLRNGWALDVANEALTQYCSDQTGEAAGTTKARWPHDFTIGQPTSAELAAGFGQLAASTHRWRDWARAHSVLLEERPRRVHGATQTLPKCINVTTIDAAADLVGGPWPERLSRSRHRLATLTALYPHLAAKSAHAIPADETAGPAPETPAVRLARLTKTVEALSDLDFDLLCRAATWFVQHRTAAGLTPRQLPIEGMQAKWLNTRHGLVRELAGVDDLGLAPPHPARLHLTYLDPDHRAGGGRLHDCASVGDTYTPPYPVRVVVISENKDTAVAFPPVAGGISVEGMGRGGATAAAFTWLTDAPLVVYWGDIDADGLEILNEFRAAGVPAKSMLMDEATYETWSRWGTNHDRKGNLIQPRAPRPTPHLQPTEQALYLRLCGPDPHGPRRLEQERILLRAALASLEALAPAFTSQIRQ